MPEMNSLAPIMNSIALAGASGRERAFTESFFLDKAYREEMALVLEEEYQYLYFQIAAVMEKKHERIRSFYGEG